MSDKETTSGDSSASSPGSVLKRCREFHGLSLEEASETTKIGISYLRALEEDRISDFANLTYLKGFLRIYANYLGLNSDDMARMYDRLGGVKVEENGIDTPVKRPARTINRMALLQKFALPAFLLVLIILTASVLKRPLPSPARPQQAPRLPVAAEVKPVQPVLSSTKVKAIPKVPEKPPVENSVVEPEPEEKSPPPQPNNAAKGFILKIRVTQTGTLTVTVDGSAPQNYDLTAGDIIEWKAEKSVKLDASNAGGIEYEMNGKPFKQLGPAGKAVYIEFDSTGLKP